MTVSWDSNVLVYAVAPSPIPHRERARELIDRGMRAGCAVLLLQTLGEFSHVAIRKAKIPVHHVRRVTEAWRAVFPVQAAADDDLPAALDAVRIHGLQFWDAMLWATARRIGVRHLLTEDLQDGRLLDGVRFVNPFNSANRELVDTILPA
ncbi:MAG: PIN domain-containing protein [Proteobacteria bacterium]|nr:PIN domain-containing protein [Pseudomonadota bacterium]